MKTYKIWRFYPDKTPKLVYEGLTLEEAKQHCKNSNTHKTDQHGNVQWFDGYREE